MSKVKLATVWLDGCSGCHMSFLDMDERLIELARARRPRLQPARGRQGISGGRRRDARRGGGLQRGGPAQDPAWSASTHEDPGRPRRLRRHRQRPGDAQHVRVDAVLKRAYLENADAERSRCRARSIPQLLPAGAAGARGRAGRRLPARLPAAGRRHLLARSATCSTGRCPTSPASAVRSRMMPWRKTITIDPVTRIEGHSQDHAPARRRRARVEDAYFHVTQFRGFEKFCEGRPFYEMPSLMARICGICPVSHLSPRPRPATRSWRCGFRETAAKLRAGPEPGADRPVARAELLLPLLAGPAARHGRRPGEAQHLRRAREEPELARGRRPPAPVRPADHRVARRQADPSRRGSFRAASTRPLTADKRDQILAVAPGVLRDHQPHARAGSSRRSRSFREEIRTFANFPSLFMGLVDGRRRARDHYDGNLRFVDANGKVVADHADPRPTPSSSARRSSPTRYLKSPYYKPLGYPGGMYRVGPLARLNVIDGMRHAARRPGMGRVPRPRARRGASARSTTTTRG